MQDTRLQSLIIRYQAVMSPLDILALVKTNVQKWALEKIADDIRSVFGGGSLSQYVDILKSVTEEVQALATPPSVSVTAPPVEEPTPRAEQTSSPPSVDAKRGRRGKRRAK
jgi:hypothetical protein